MVTLLFYLNMIYHAYYLTKDMITQYEHRRMQFMYHVQNTKKVK